MDIQKRRSTGRDLESQSARSSKYEKKPREKVSQRQKFWPMLFLTMLCILFIRLFVKELYKGTDGNPLIVWAYQQMGRLDDYQKSGKIFASPTSVLKSAAHGTFVGAQGYNTDKITRHNYSAYYDIVMKPYLEQTVNVMEVGVRKGGSLKLWRELFSFDSQIWGIDINDYVPQFPKDANIKVLIGSSTSPEEAKRLYKTLKHKQFDIIVDDGDHNDWAQKLTFDLMGPLLKDTGVYIIEDNFIDDGRHYYYDKCGFDVSIHNDVSGEMLTILYPSNSIAGITDLGRVGKVFPRTKTKNCPSKYGPIK